MNQTAIIAIVSTYRRPKELKRLLDSLAASHDVPLGIVVNDNFGDPAVSEIVKTYGPHAHYVKGPAQDDRSCAARGWNRALAEAVRRFESTASHYLIIDDDAVLEPETIDFMLEALERTGAKSAFPSALNPMGDHYPTAMMTDNRWEDAKKTCRTRSDVLSVFQDECPKAWLFQGLCHLMHRDVVLSGIRFDENFWMCGEDLDFSVRVAQKWQSVYAPKAFVWHLWGEPLNPGNARNSNYLKTLSLMQNITFMGYWRPYGRKIRGRYFDFLRGKGAWGTYRDLFREFGVNPCTIFDFIWILYFGMIKGEASNQPSGHALRRRRKHYLVENTPKESGI